MSSIQHTLPTRREFLLRGAAAGGFAAAVWASPSPMRRIGGMDPVLVVLFLRGAADGLGLVVPIADPNFDLLRPTVRTDPGELLDLDGFFAFHPNLAPLLPLYQSGELAVVHAVGSPDPSRSHFAAQDFMDRAAPGDTGATTGWLNSYLSTAGFPGIHSAITLGTGTSPSLLGPADSLAFGALSKFNVTDARAAERRAALESMNASEAGTLLGNASDGAFATLDTLSLVDTTTSVEYPASSFGNEMKDIAALVKADIGVRVVAVNLGGWDHHSNEVDRMETSAAGLADVLAAFHSDLGLHANRTLTLAMTEFGRTCAQNGSGGTDHGPGSMMLALGGGVSGNQVLLRNGLWPGLVKDAMFEGRDLAVTTDFRDVFAESLDRHMGLGDLSSIFPNYTPKRADYAGLFV